MSEEQATEEVTSETTTAESTAETAEVVETKEETPAAETTTETATEPVPAWSDNWHDEVAKEFAGDDEKAAEKAAKSLKQFYKTPADLYRKMREQDEYIRGGGLVKVPGEDASEDEIAAYNKAIGVPEKPEDYLENIKLSDGVELGDADREIAKDLAQALHPLGVTPKGFNGLLDWYYKANTAQEEQMVEIDEKDKYEAEKAMVEAYGPKRKSIQTAILNSFNGNSELHDSLMNGRLADGRLIKYAPEVIDYLQKQALTANPTAASIVEGQVNGVSVEAELKDIRKAMREDRRAYNKDTKMQERFKELLQIEQGMKA